LKFLGRARKFFQELASEPETKVQYFNVTCAAGHRVRGERTEGYQALRCPACGEGIFVLPRSPLPMPAAPTRSSSSKRAGMGGAWVEEGPVELTDPGRAALEVGGDEPSPADAEIIWDDQPAESTGRAGHSHTRGHPADAGAATAEEDDAFWEDDLKRVAATRSPDASERSSRKSAPNAGPPARPATARPSRAGQRARATPETAGGQLLEAPALAGVEPKSGKRQLSRLSLVLIVVPLLVIATVAWRVRQHGRQEYPLIAERGKTEGIPALEEGDFDRAYQLLSAAKSAVDALGGAVDNAEEIRNAAAEAALFVDQTRSLEEMLDDAGRTDPQIWASKFDTLYKGRAIWIDCSIHDEPEPGRRSRYLLDYVVLPPGAANNFGEGRSSRPPRFGLIDLTGFELFELARPRKGDHVTFGARLASFQFDATSNVWLIGLEPKSGVFITHTKALEAAGLRDRTNAEMPAESQP